MKRIILLIGVASSLLLASCSTDANDVELMTSEQDNARKASIVPVTQSQAKTATINFLSSARQGSAKGLPTLTEESIDEIQTIENEDSIPVMHIINLKENAGFVVMSACLAERPILAYSNEGVFDMDAVNEYDGVIDWMATKYLKINGLIEIGAFPTEQIASQWNAVNPSLGVGLVDNDGNFIPWIPPVVIDFWDDVDTYGPYLSTRWNQRLSSNPGNSVIGYNNYVRFENCSSGIAPVGCVATAMGQIMKYHNHPNIYNINSMPDIVNGANYTSTSANDIAFFMQNIGHNVNMDYSCTGSGAYSSVARNSFILNYGYHASGLTPLSYNPLESNIKSGNPVYLDGCRTRTIKTQPVRIGIFRFSIGKTTYSYDNCHAWVADGLEEIVRTYVYDNGTVASAVIAEHFHMNWGWGGFLNGWYHYESWDDINGNNIPDVDYIYKQNIIYDIIPQ